MKFVNKLIKYWCDHNIFLLEKAKMIKINVYDPNQENDSNTDPDEIIHVFYPLKKAKL